MLDIPFHLEENHFICYMYCVKIFCIKSSNIIIGWKFEVNICLVYYTSSWWKLQMSRSLYCVIIYKFLQFVCVDESIQWHCQFFRTFLKVNFIVCTCLEKPVQYFLWNFGGIVVCSGLWSHPESISLLFKCALLFYPDDEGSRFPWNGSDPPDYRCHSNCWLNCLFLLMWETNQGSQIVLFLTVWYVVYLGAANCDISKSHPCSAGVAALFSIYQVPQRSGKYHNIWSPKKPISTLLVFTREKLYRRIRKSSLVGEIPMWCVYSGKLMTK